MNHFSLPVEAAGLQNCGFYLEKKYCCKYPGYRTRYYINISEVFVNKHFFKFPKDSKIHQLWKNVWKIDQSQLWTVCEDHFNESAFVKMRKERLNFGAVPVFTAN